MGIAEALQNVPGLKLPATALPILLKALDRESFNRVPEVNGFVKGFGGVAPDELEGSVLDPRLERAKRGAKVGFPAGIAANVVPLLSPGLKALKGSAAVPRLGSNQAGAITLGGDPNFVLSHAFPAYKHEALSSRPQKMADSGEVIGAPAAVVNSSWQATHGKGNAFASNRDAVIAAADSIDPMMYPGSVHGNRDIYSPTDVGTAYDSQKGRSILDLKQNKKVIKTELDVAKAKFGTEDIRLTQMLPGYEEVLGIMTSPNFKTMKDFEYSKFGGGLLKSPGNAESAYALKQELIAQGIKDKDELLDLYRKMNAGYVPPPAIQNILKRARGIESTGTELKLYGAHGLTDQNSIIYRPPHSLGDLEALTPLRDRGMRIVSGADLLNSEGLTPPHAASQKASLLVPKLAPSSGGIWQPPRAPVGTNAWENSAEFMDFIHSTPVDLPTSPHYKQPPKIFDMGKAAAPPVEDFGVPTFGAPKVFPKTASGWEKGTGGLPKAPPPPQPDPKAAMENWMKAATAFDPPKLKSGPIEFSSEFFNQVGGKPGGSNPGGIYQDKLGGGKYLFKHPATLEHAKDEELASRLYNLAGIPVAPVKAGNFGGKPTSKVDWIEDLKPVTLDDMAKSPDVRHGFAVDAWLANWDVVGLTDDNIMRQGNSLRRIDLGGTLRWRAQGGPKGSQWGESPQEVLTFMKADLNPKTAKVFANLTKSEAETALKLLGDVKGFAIEDAVKRAYGEGPEAQAMIKTLLRRKDAILSLGPDGLMAVTKK